MKAYQADIAKFETTDTQIFGISVDSIPANREFAKQNAITFPLLSDFKRTVVRDYGIFNEDQGFGNRATFVIDKDGIIQHIKEGNEAIDTTSDDNLQGLLRGAKTEGRAGNKEDVVEGLDSDDRPWRRRAKENTRRCA